MLDKSLAELQRTLAAQDRQLQRIKDAEAKFESDGDTQRLVRFWEKLWSHGGLLFYGSHWTFRLTDLYISLKDYQSALRAVKLIQNPCYEDKKESYIAKIEKKLAKQKD